MQRHGLMIATLGLLLAAGTASAQRAPSPLPSFDTESGIPWVARSIINTDTLVDIGTVKDTPFYGMARIVARVEDPTGDGFCSGFRLGEDLFMTNFHCWEVAQCELQFHMAYENNLPTDQQGTFKCVEVLEKVERLDFALYRVERVDQNTDIDFPIGRLTTKALTVGMPLLVPGHPAARPKQIDISDECHLTRAVPYPWYDRENIQHKCDTMGGSSGSPVLDRATGHIVGIHWGAAGDTGSNHAIPATLIIEHLRTTMPDVLAELQVVAD